jgi:hypothetical protein
MESARFDALVRVFGASSRHGLLRVGLGSAMATALATLGFALRDEVAAGGACKPACGTCQRCKKGKCKKKKGKRKCKKGRCRPQAAGTPCAGGACCAAGSGQLFDGCCPVTRPACCPNASGGGCCDALDDCCVDNADCVGVAICSDGCCLLI